MPSMRGSGPVSLHGFGKVEVPKEIYQQRVKLRVVDADDMESVYCEAHTSIASAWCLPDTLPAFVQLAGGSDCVLPIRSSSEVPSGVLALTAVQQFNLRVASGHSYEFSLWQPPSDQLLSLRVMDVEVRQLYRSHDAPHREVDGRRLAKLLLGRCFGCMVAVNEMIVVIYDGLPMCVRVTQVNTLDEHEREAVVGYHCYRGQVTHDTEIYIHSVQDQHGDNTGDTLGHMSEHASSSNVDATSLARQLRGLQVDCENDDGDASGSGSTAVQLVNCRSRPPPGKSRNTVHVVTNDGEWFPVPRILLRTAIKLTSAVRSEEDEPQVAVDIDTLTFDRILIFLESEALQHAPPNFALHLLEALDEGAEKLGLQSLQSYCKSRLGAAESQLRVFRLEEIQHVNANNCCWIVIDGMVLDVTRWLPEHPGGSTIIPNQSLNVDATRFFEVYHASRESFLYLKQFYIGELALEDRCRLPCQQAPSPEFLLQLRQYTTFRMSLTDAKEKVFKSF